MPKPILVLKIPTNVLFDTDTPMDVIAKTTEHLEKKLQYDYHVIVLPLHESDEFDVKV